MIVSGFDSGVDVVVTNYRTEDDLTRFCESYESGTAGIDSSLAIMNVAPLVDFDAPKGAFLHNFEANCGYAVASNYGASVGNREVVALFNADTVLFDNTLKECHDSLMAHDDWGVLGPLQVNSNGAITSAGVDGTNSNPHMRGWRSRRIERFRDTIEAVTVSGSAYFVKREAWNELTNCPVYRESHPSAEGAFLPTRHYYEETWCSYHARAHGWKVIYFGQAAMIHEWHKASPVGGWAEKQMTESRKVFRRMCQRHGIDHD